MGKHTPGPWIVTKDPHGTSDDYCIGVADGNIDQIAVCSERDARLIAAAPELVDALKLWARWDDMTEAELALALEATAAALAKAGAV